MTWLGSGAVPPDRAWQPQGFLRHLPCLRLGWLNPQQLLFGNCFSRRLPEDTAYCPDCSGRAVWSGAGGGCRGWKGAGPVLGTSMRGPSPPGPLCPREQG